MCGQVQSPIVCESTWVRLIPMGTPPAYDDQYNNKQGICHADALCIPSSTNYGGRIRRASFLVPSWCMRSITRDRPLAQGSWPGPRWRHYRSGGRCRRCAPGRKRASLQRWRSYRRRLRCRPPAKLLLESGPTLSQAHVTGFDLCLGVVSLAWKGIIKWQ